MKRIGYDSYGGPEVMYVQDFEPAPLGTRDVLVTVKAASINPIDWKIRQGDMKLFSGKASHRAMGSEFAGVVQRVGSGVVDFRPGDEVVGATTFKGQGAFAEAVVTSETLLAKKPPALSFIEATAVALVGVTAWLALVKTAKLKSGQQVLINGALGGVGQAAVTLAKSLGARTTGRVSAKGMKEAEALGLDRVLDYANPLPQTMAHSFDVIFDVAGSLTTKQSREFLKPGGVVVDINPTGPKMLAALLTKRQKLVFAKGSRENLETVLALAAKGSLKAPANQVRPFAEAIALITALERGQRVPGKSVIVFD